MEPILTYSDITGSVYIATKYRRIGRVILDAQEKFDVTDWVEKYAKKRNAQTVEENAKLRELVADTYQAFQRVIPDGHRLDLEQRMRELGVEFYA